jgi:hypothetical protein
MMGYGRNPLAAYKTSARGNKSDGSWARRYGYVRGAGDLFRSLGVNSSRVPVDPRWLAGMLGRFFQGLGDILATRQVHVTVYVERLDDDGIARIHCYVHDEPNSLNPLTALSHYQASTWKAAKGVQAFQDDCSAHGVPLNQPNA